jgi:hypothetical protein
VLASARAGRLFKRLQREKTMDHDGIIKNRADRDGGVKPSECLDCNEELLFAMRDAHHEFSIGLRTILQCLRLAEQEGNVPPLPIQWWNLIASRHGMFFLTDYKRE